MAGIHCCYRKLLFLNTVRLADRNGVLLQLTRKRHTLIFQMSSLKNRISLQKPNLLHNANKLLLYRLASTNIIESNDVASDSSLKVKNDSNQLTSEPVQSSNEPQVVESSNAIIIDESSLPEIPSEVHDVPVPVEDFIALGLKEPTFQSLGLGSWWPSGCIQQVLEYLHINLDLPWWASIIIITCIFRTFLVPFTLKNRNQSINMMNNHMPVITKYTEKIKEAKLQGDYYSVSLHNQELQKYIRDNNISFFGFLKLALIQTPIFLSVYYALKGMIGAPVESLKTGGLFWFQDLTVPDPYYILPVVLATSLVLVIETGAEGVPGTPKLKWLFRGVSLLVLVVSSRFPAGMTWYWSISNTISLCLVCIYKIPVVKKALKIPDFNPQNQQLLKRQKKGFISEFKEGIEMAKITNKIMERERLNEISFQKAGTGPVPRTFKKNPLLENAKKSS